MDIGDSVTPITPAGLCLADCPVDGTFEQKRENVCVFKGIGEIIDIKAGAASTEAFGKGIEIKSNFKPIVDKSQVVIKADWLDTYLGTGTGSKADKTAN